MKCGRKTARGLMALVAVIVLTFSIQLAAWAEGQSDDNSLSSLGITTQGVTVSPDFSYDHLTYDVVVPAGTTELALDPVLSNPNATINSIDGTTLTNGTGTVTITVTAPSGAMTAYTLNVTTAADTNVDPATAISEKESQRASETQAQTQSETQPVTETEDSRYVKVDKNTLKDAEDTISRLQSDLQVYKDRSHTFTYVIYALIAGCVVLLFLVVNLLIRKKDIAAELNTYKKQRKLPEGFDDTGDVIPQDGWLDDEPDERASRKQKKNKRGMTVPSYGETDDLIMDVPPVAPGTRQNAQTSWTQQQVGTPVMPPKEYTPYNGYAKTGRQTKPAGGHGTQGAGSTSMDETRRYSVPQHEEGMKKTPAPGDQTIVLPGKKLTRAEKAAARKAEKEARKAKKEEQESRWKKAPAPGENPYAGQQGYPGVMPAGGDMKDTVSRDQQPAQVQIPSQPQGQSQPSQVQVPSQPQEQSQPSQAPVQPAQGQPQPRRLNPDQKDDGVKVDMIDL